MQNSLNSTKNDLLKFGQILLSGKYAKSEH